MRVVIRKMVFQVGMSVWGWVPSAYVSQWAGPVVRPFVSRFLWFPAHSREYKNKNSEHEFEPFTLSFAGLLTTPNLTRRAHQNLKVTDYTPLVNDG